MFQINQPEFDVYREYLVQGLEHDNVKAYLQALVDIAVTFGANRKDAEQELRESVNFEVELARVSGKNFIQFSCKLLN